ncbi:MAG: RNase adaptor protein RapZ [Deltaproteobacteria bacterium RBG_13_49_15]|nr:MAG: RNase adaptor protein RapZ [Deltaproteobacteria bacterium RBG_13_49_15]
MTTLKIFIITGLSGSGKSVALNAFEDAGFYCVDNLPVTLLPKFLELPVENESEIAGLAFVMDIREKGFLSSYASVLESLKQKGYHFEILFLDAHEKVLLQRFSLTRRQHPLSKDKNLLESIRAEQEQLQELKKEAGTILDTSNFTIHELKAAIFNIVKKAESPAELRIHVQSFGYKFGVPIESDLIMDVRFLANPFFVTELKPLDGETEAVRKYVLENPMAEGFMSKYMDLLDYLIPLYEKDGRSYLTISIGCTGGRHRSVTIARAIVEHVMKKGKQVKITHRDIDR